LNLQSRFDPIGRREDGGSFEHLLATGVDDHTAGFARGAAGSDRSVNRQANLAGEEVLQCDSSDRILEQIARKLGDTLRQPDPHFRWWSIGIGLDMVDVQREAAEIVGAAQIFVGFVSSPVEASEFSL